MNKNKYVENGVKLSKVNVIVGDEVTVTYNGLLAANGAQNVYAHVGFGEHWSEIMDVPMTKDKKGDFKAKIKISGYDSLNMCFKDDVNNWDNNHSYNYSFDVLNKKTETKGKAKSVNTTTTTAKNSKEKTKTKTANNSKTTAKNVIKKS